MKNSNKKGFTLVELLVVIAIIGILFIVLISKVDFATDKAKESGVQTDFRSFQTAFETVAREHQGFDCLVDTSDPGNIDYSVLISEINKNLDPKLLFEKVAVDAGVVTDYKGNDADCDLVMKTKTAKDPWKESYIFYYHMGVEAKATGEGKGNRGTISVISKGSNLDEQVEFDVDMFCPNGKDGTASSGDENGSYIRKTSDATADDYILTTIYTFENGYGEVVTITKGFSNNQVDPTANDVNY